MDMLLRELLELIKERFKTTDLLLYHWEKLGDEVVHPLVTHTGMLDLDGDFAGLADDDLLLIFNVIFYLKSDKFRDAYIEGYRADSAPEASELSQSSYTDEEADDGMFGCSMFDEDLAALDDTSAVEREIKAQQRKLFELSFNIRAYLCRKSSIMLDLLRSQLFNYSQKPRASIKSDAVMIDDLRSVIHEHLNKNKIAFYGYRFIHEDLVSIVVANLDPNLIRKATIIELEAIERYYLPTYLDEIPGLEQEVGSDGLTICYFLHEAIHYLEANPKASPDDVLVRATQRLVTEDSDRIKPLITDQLSKLYYSSSLNDVFDDILKSSMDSVDSSFGFEEPAETLHTLISQLAWTYDELVSQHQLEGLTELYRRLGKEMPPHCDNPVSYSEALYALLADNMVDYTGQDKSDIDSLNHALVNGEDISETLNDRFCILQFRGINYSRAHFDHAARVRHRNAATDGVFSFAAVKRAIERYNTNLPKSAKSMSLKLFLSGQYDETFVRDLVVAGELIKSRLMLLEKIKDEILIDGRTYSDGLTLLYSLFVNDYEKFKLILNSYFTFCEELRQAGKPCGFAANEPAYRGHEHHHYFRMLDVVRTGVHPYSEPSDDDCVEELFLADVPFVSMSSTIHHPLKYASTKFYEGYKAYRIVNHWFEDGRVDHPYQGKVYAIALTPYDVIHHQRPLVALSLSSSGAVAIDDKVLTERESTFFGYIPSESIIYDENVRVPALDGWFPEYEIKYGLSKERYEEFSGKIKSLMTKAGRTFKQEEYFDRLVGDENSGYLASLRRRDKVTANPDGVLTDYNKTVGRLDAILRPMRFYMEMNILLKVQALCLEQGKKPLFIGNNGRFTTEIPFNILERSRSQAVGAASVDEQAEPPIASPADEMLQEVTPEEPEAATSGGRLRNITNVVGEAVELRSLLKSSYNRLSFSDEPSPSAAGGDSSKEPSLEHMPPLLEDDMVFGTPVDQENITFHTSPFFKHNSRRDYQSIESIRCRNAVKEAGKPKLEAVRALRSSTRQFR